VALFQRAADITSKVEEGSADLGIVGLDRFMESRREAGDAIVLVDDLGFGRCELVLAVPEAWVDVTSTADLADLGVEFREKGREIRIATKYPLLVERFLYGHGVNYFSLVPTSGTLEAAPAIGYADLIADLTASGATLRENGLKTLDDGSILVSQACLIANRRLLGRGTAKLQGAKMLLERIEGHLRSREYCSITANVQGASEDAVAARILDHRDLSGVQGPTIATVHSPEGSGWYAVTVVVQKRDTLEAIEHLRRMGGNGIAVVPMLYLFQTECAAYQRLLASLG
jgi:ATP phosphoribosyltransferase